MVSPLPLTSHIDQGICSSVWDCPGGKEAGRTCANGAKLTKQACRIQNGAISPEHGSL